MDFELNLEDACDNNPEELNLPFKLSQEPCDSCGDATVTVINNYGSGTGSGTSGREVQLQAAGNWLQWRYVGDSTWMNLVSLDNLKGASGASGADGSLARTGSGAPSNTLGKDGDFYINMTTGDFYTRAGGTYSISGNLRGPQGPAGDSAAATIQAFSSTTALRASTFYTIAGTLIAKNLELNGAEYLYNPASTSTDDGFLCIKPTAVSGTGRFERVFKGKTRAVEAGLKSDGTNQASVLQTLCANSSIKHLVIDSDITINSSVDCSNKRLQFENGAKLLGSGSLTNVVITAPLEQQIFATSLGVSGLPKSSVAWWGARRDGLNATLTAQAFQAAIDATATGGVVVVPTDLSLGNSVYFLDSTITIREDIRLIGDGPILNPQAKLFWVQNTLGINIAASGAKRVHLSNLWLQQQTAESYDTTKHAIQSNTFIYFDNLHFFNIAGNGVHVVANSPTSNADHSRIDNCYFNNCNIGLFIEGTDANILNVTNNDFTLNRRWGLYSNGFLGNIQINNHFAENGKQNDVMVTYGGQTYVARNLVGDSNIGHQPDISTGYWELCPFNLGYPAWDSSKSYYSGGTYAVVNANARELILNTYTEFTQGRGIISPRSIRIGGLAEDGGPLGGVNMDANAGQLLIGKDVVIKGYLQVGERILTQHFKSTVGGGHWVSDEGGSEYSAGIAGYNNRLELWNQATAAAYFNSDNTLNLVVTPDNTDNTNRVPTTAWVRALIATIGGGGGGSSNWTVAGNNLTNNNGASGGLIVSSSLYLNVDAYPSAISNAYYITTGLSGGLSARHIFGDGSGWSMAYSKRTASTTTDLFLMYDTGDFSASRNLIAAGALLGNKLGVGNGTTNPQETAAFGYGANTDVAIGTATGNKLFISGYSNIGLVGFNRKPSTGDFTISGVGATEIRMSATSTGAYFDIGVFAPGSSVYLSRLKFDEAGILTVPNLAGTGNRLVVADDTGALSTQVLTSLLSNSADTYTGTAKVQSVISLSQAEYDAIGTPDANTLYVIV